MTTYSTINTTGVTSGPSLSTVTAPYLTVPIGPSAGSIYTMNTPSFDNGLTCAGTISADDVKIDGQSIKELMKTISDRLAILSPNFEKMDKFAILKNIYEQYKFTEALLGDDTDGAK